MQSQDKEKRESWFVSEDWLNTKIEIENISDQRFILEDKIETVPAVCSFFGCSKRLSLRQQMAGNRCEDHPKGLNPLL